jgi:hypothetical protein
MVETRYLAEELADVAESIRQFDAGVAAALSAVEQQNCSPELILETFALAGEADFYLSQLEAAVTLLPPTAGQAHFIETVKSSYTECDALLEVVELAPYLDHPAYDWDAIQEAIRGVARNVEENALWLGQSGFALSPPPFLEEEFELLHDVISGRDLLGWTHFATSRRRVDGRLQGFNPELILKSTSYADLLIERLLMRLTVRGIRLPARSAPAEFFWSVGRYASDLPIAEQDISEKYADFIP